ncbi:hypothetical protein AGMMS4956_04450 [Bacteroidia bacterium]|nr:hypothetical protein AGMMS4956_04450 [Bacteroidia bacterium]
MDCNSDQWNAVGAGSARPSARPDGQNVPKHIPLPYYRPHIIAGYNLFEIAFVVHIKNDDGQAIFFAQSKGG